jgi:hypothetical protein
VYLGEPRSREELDRLSWSELPVPAERPDDVAVIADALRACCLENVLVDGSYRVRARVPDRPIRLDLRGCRATAPGGPHDPPELAHHLPPAWCRRAGGDVIFVEIHDLGEIPARAAVLFELGR